MDIANHDTLYKLAFHNSSLAKIVFVVGSGKIVLANKAACKLLGYSGKELLSIRRKAIFDNSSKENKEMVAKSKTDKVSTAFVSVKKKNGKQVFCEVTSSIVIDKFGIEKAITNFRDMSQSIQRQNGIDIKNEKIVADNIAIAKSAQIEIDIKNEQIVADDIAIAKSTQKEIDIKNGKIVANNIAIAKSAQLKIDTKNEKIVADDIAIAKSAQIAIDIKKEKIVANNIAIAKSAQIEIDIKNEQIVADDIAIAKSAQIEIDIKNHKTVSDNIKIAQTKSNARIIENNKWIKYIAKSSYDVMWDWDLSTNDIYIGDSFEEVFGYKLANNSISFNEFIGYIPAKDKKAVKKRLLKILSSGQKSWHDAYMFKRKDGTVASTISRACIVRNEKGKALRLIGALQDISKLQDLEKQLAEKVNIKKDHEERYEIVSKLSYDGVWDWNLITNDFFLGDGFEELFGKKITSSLTDWSSHLHPEDKEAVEKSIQEAITSSARNWHYAYRFVKTDGSAVNVLGRATIIRDAEGKAYRMIGAVHDISKQKILEERLELEIKLKEKQIAEATEDAKSVERSNIGKELHDNINQLLGASKMYMEMAKRGGSNSEMYMDRSSEYTLTAINEIRKLTKGLTGDMIKNFGLCDAIANIAHDIMELSPLKILYVMKSFKEDSVHDKFKLNIYRIVQEQLNNILKHAIAKKVLITLVQKDNSITLIVSDDGVGFDPSKKRKGIGVDNIKSRAASYNGKAEFVSQPGKGCILTAKFSIDSYAL